MQIHFLLICEGCGEAESFGNLYTEAPFGVLNWEMGNSLHCWLSVKHPDFSVLLCFDVCDSFHLQYLCHFSPRVEVPRLVSYQAFEDGRGNDSVSPLSG